jgi:hypothetical protein
MKYTTIWLLLCGLFLSGCTYRDRENELNKRESALNNKLKEILVKEKALDLREAEIEKSRMQLDSTLQDSAQLVDPRITGKWEVDMQCIEATCPQSAVGDSKSEVWLIYHRGKTVVAEATANNQLARVYTGEYIDNTIQLSADNQDTIGTSAKMAVQLHAIDSISMEGRREITRDACKVVYTLQLRRKSS